MKRVLALFGIVALSAATGCACMRSNRCYGGSRTERVTMTPAPCQTSDCFDMVGPRGADGPTGVAGERGPTGQTGAAGYAVAGPRGGPGATGSIGDQGPIGPTGQSGQVVRGRTGPTGPAGPSGMQGSIGETGVRGDSAPGYAGPSGAQGPSGPTGAVGLAGARGPALEGPTGPAGRSGPSGAQGATGYTGAQGITTAGVAGSTGPTGSRGPQGPTGEMGAQGSVGIVTCWTSYRDFWFQGNSAELQPSETHRFVEIAAYMNRNPSLKIGIDSSVNSRGTNGQYPSLNDRRVNAVRDALVDAGVPNNKISVGDFGDEQLRRDSRVELLLATAN